MGSAFMVRLPGFHPAVCFWVMVGLGRSQDTCVAFTVTGSIYRSPIKSTSHKAKPTDNRVGQPQRTGADLPVLVGEVDCLNESNCLVHVPPDRQVVDRHLPL